MSDGHKTLGDVMEEQASGWVTIAMAGGFLLYLGGIAYVTIHNINLFTNTGVLPPELLVWGYVTALILAVNAIVLPVLIHFYFAPGGQKEFATLVYICDILVAIGNTVVDSIFNRGNKLVGIEAFYFQYIVVITPILFGVVAWAIIFRLDPSQKEREAKAKAKSAADKLRRERMVQQAKTDEAIDQAITLRAKGDARAATAAVTGFRPADLDTATRQGQLPEMEMIQSAVAQALANLGLSPNNGAAQSLSSNASQANPTSASPNFALTEQPHRANFGIEQLRQMFHENGLDTLAALFTKPQAKSEPVPESAPEQIRLNGHEPQAGTSTTDVAGG